MAAITSMPDYDNDEEYYAVLLTNIYSSERGGTFVNLRKSHRLRYNEMKRAEEMPFVFLFEDDNFRLIEKFCNQQPDMASMIAIARCTYGQSRRSSVLARPSYTQTDHRLASSRYAVTELGLAGKKRIGDRLHSVLL
jgi:hypothetical protein